MILLISPNGSFLVVRFSQLVNIVLSSPLVAHLKRQILMPLAICTPTSSLMETRVFLPLFDQTDPSPNSLDLNRTTNTQSNSNLYPGGFLSLVLSVTIRFQLLPHATASKSLVLLKTPSFLPPVVSTINQLLLRSLLQQKVLKFGILLMVVILRLGWATFTLRQLKFLKLQFFERQLTNSGFPLPTLIPRPMFLSTMW